MSKAKLSGQQNTHFVYILMWRPGVGVVGGEEFCVYMYVKCNLLCIKNNKGI